MARIPLVLLPGLLCDARLWRAQAEGLADLAEVTVADLTGADSVAGLARAVLAAAPARFAVAGLSMGGYVLQEMLRQEPGRLERIALLDTSAAADRPEQGERRRAQMALAAEGRLAEVVETLLPGLVHPDRLADAELTGVVRAMAETVGAPAFVRQQTAIMGRPDGWADLARVACPALVLCGADDALTPPAPHERMAQAIAGSRLVVVGDCGHLSPLEQPAAVNAALREWLGA